jgi:hypothetical protein
MTHLRAALTVTAASIAAAASPLAAPHASAATAPTPNPFLGTRNVVLLPVASEGILGIDRDLQATYVEEQGKRHQFVLVNSGKRYLIKTAFIRRGGEPLCMKLGSNEVEVTACDASNRHQLFSFRPGTPSNGKPTWTIRTTKHRYLVQDDLGSFESAWIGEGTDDIDTPFLLGDKGLANLPVLDRPHHQST